MYDAFPSAGIRAGAYEDNVYSLDERRLLFLRWLIQQGWVNEWEEGDAAPEERLPTALGGAHQSRAQRGGND
jgi:hypothetical protein